MDTNKHETNTLARLEAVLDTYGADPARWPQHERAGLERLIETDGRAQRLFAEAGALQRVMAHAPAGAGGEALKQRIIAAVVNDETRAARVAPLSAAARASGSRRVVRRSVIWPAAALAASFALGLYLGLSGLGVAALDDAIRFAQINGNSGEAGQVSWLADAPVGDAEDLL